MSIHHITNEMVANKPSFAGSAFERDLSERLANGIMVAHNARILTTCSVPKGVQIKHGTYRVTYALDTEDTIPEYNLQCRSIT
ncbi:MAG: hypothetical protein U1F40_06225 [Turneriella sp.]